MDLDDESGEQSETPLDMSVNRSGMIRIAAEDPASQTEVNFHSLPQPPIRNLRDIDPRVKKACVKVSVKCSMSDTLRLIEKNRLSQTQRQTDRLTHTQNRSVYVWT